MATISYELIVLVGSAVPCASLSLESSSSTHSAVLCLRFQRLESRCLRINRLSLTVVLDCLDTVISRNESCR